MANIYDLLKNKRPLEIEEIDPLEIERVEELEIEPISGGEASGEAPISPASTLFSSTSDQLRKFGAPELNPSRVQQEPAPSAALLEAVKSFQDKPHKPVENPLLALLGAQNNRLGEAQSNRNGMQLLAMLGQAGERASSALAGVKQQETPVYSELLKQASQGVDDIGKEQELAQGLIKTQSAQAEAKNAIDRNDPQSQISKIGQEIFIAAAKQAGMDPNRFGDVSNVSVANLDKVLNGVESMANRRYVADKNSDAKEEAKSDKKSKSDAMQADKVRSLLESARGNPEVQLAQRNKHLVKNALTLLNQYPNPDDMPTKQVKLLVSEIGKIASGGVPAMSELKEMMPETLRYKVAEIWSKASGKPEKARVGEFLKVYRDYLSELDMNASDAINEKYHRVLETAKNHLA